MHFEFFGNGQEFQSVSLTCIHKGFPINTSRQQQCHAEELEKKKIIFSHANRAQTNNNNKKNSSFESIPILLLACLIRAQSTKTLRMILNRSFHQIKTKDQMSYKQHCCLCQSLPPVQDIWVCLNNTVLICKGWNGAFEMWVGE